ncbi:hypothetical protein [Leptospira alstonii]|uniref:Lipoprotein n=2 Tax=Leptospira alstonii TaxID=28452 RepID=T0FMB3_9LEPT|nr:hypothetical protein [Leptospira alstonii]EMJ92886.1 putative lipoprotein [Leptospira alstonii serovar Sichuan str. 79601]EQA78890.1 putative lipoprotein [Leptospira alstonii serovar Pingchang str. 80-412]
MKLFLKLILLNFLALGFFAISCKKDINSNAEENDALFEKLNNYYISVGYNPIKKTDIDEITRLTIDGESKRDYKMIKFLSVFYKLSSLSLQNLKFSHVPSTELGNLERISLGELVIENCDITDEQLSLFINKANKIFRVAIFNAPNITDKSLDLLLSLKEIDEIYVVNTGISQEGMSKLSSKFGEKLREPGHVLGE